MAINSINPANGETLKVFEPLSEAQLDEKLQCAAETFEKFRRTSFTLRAVWMQRTAEILEGEKDRFARIMTAEMGKTFKSAGEEVIKSAWACRYYVENAERFMADEEVSTLAARSYIHYQPLGPVLAVMPWNYPFWQVFRFAAPALMAGNVGLLKHASNVPQSALAIEEIFQRAGFPEGAFQTLLIGSDHVVKVIDDPRVKAVTLTGSNPAGVQVAGEAGKQLKKTVLELGGSDPFIVMPSADLDWTTKMAVSARVLNNGESCIAAKRFIVAEAVADEFERKFVQNMAALKVGDPMDPSTDVGPLATPSILEGVEQQVRGCVEKGARVLTGGKRLDRPGNFYEPTILTGISKDSPGYGEEVFGPVAMLFRVANIDEAIHLANDVDFGLGSSAWTQDENEQKRFIDELDAGMVFINGMVASDPRLPFGGVKGSGYGRELGGLGIREFLNIKTVWIGKGNQAGSKTE